MKLQARHTSIVETLTTEFGFVVREDYFGYPESESNLYMVDDSNRPIWFAERLMPDDAYANPLHRINSQSVTCSSWKGFTCQIDLRTGKIAHSEFTR